MSGKKIFVVAGAPFTGKTSLVKELDKYFKNFCLKPYGYERLVTVTDTYPNIEKLFQEANNVFVFDGFYKPNTDIDTVFLCPPWKKIYEIEKRSLGWDEILNMDKNLRKRCEESGYKIVEVPKIDVKERAIFVAERILSTLPTLPQTSGQV